MSELSQSTASAMLVEAGNVGTLSRVEVAPSGEAPGHELIGRLLIIAYSHYIFDARVKRHAEALAHNGYAVDVICLADEHEGEKWVNLIPISAPRYRGHSRTEYLRQYI